MGFFKRSQNKRKEEDILPLEEGGENEYTDSQTMSADQQASISAAMAQLTQGANFQQLVREEAKRMRISEQLLSESHITRIEDALRLNETKMDNIEENLNRTRRQQERVRRYQEVLLELNEQKQHLYEVNKQLAACVKERDELDRFEEFENIQSQFQRLNLLEELRREQKQRLSELTRELDSTNHELENENKVLLQKRDELRDIIRKTQAGLDAVAEALKIEGRSTYVAILERELGERLAHEKSQQTALEKEMQEHRAHMEKIHVSIEQLRTRRQSLAAYHSMAKHGELVLERLSNLSMLETELEKADQQLRENERKQTDANDMLGRVYAEYQQIQQEIQALQDELHVHRDYNHGLEGYLLQERAMHLKLRREMLVGGHSLWIRIANGYAMIEDIMQKINTLRLKEDNLTTNIGNLERELNILRRNCHEKEYTFTLSKSQNVIQLRSDLKEGCSCTVCGATHHPYHSDTMLEQNMLIGEIKMEYEAMATELRAKEQLLREMELELSNVKATRDESENTMITLRGLQNAYTQDWQTYASLDSTFQSCDSSVNAPARTAMLRQLIENIGTEVDSAQKELDIFNFHQNRINELTEQISAKEQTKTEIITRLNEVNTGCQVMAGQLEHAQNQKQTIRDNYSRLYETVDNMVSIPDWKNIWGHSHEALIMRIKEIIKEWSDINDKLKSLEQERDMKEQKLAYLQQTHQTLIALISQLEDDCRDCHENLDEGKKNLERLIGRQSTKELLGSLLDNYGSGRKQLNKQFEKRKQYELKQKEMQGRQSDNIEWGNITDERAATERQKVDIWIRQYNANHPPVQYDELREKFAIDRNWNDIRAELRTIQMDAMLTQSRVDKLGSQLVALQAEGSMNGIDVDVLQGQLSTQIETYESRQRETMLQVAMLTQQLNAHRKAENAIKEEQMTEK